MSDKQLMTEQEQEQAELEAERRFRSRVHKHMGMTASILVVIAMAVGLWRVASVSKFNAWQVLKIGGTAIPWILGLFLLAVVFSMGTTRILLAITSLKKRFRMK